MLQWGNDGTEAKNFLKTNVLFTRLFLKMKRKMPSHSILFALPISPTTPPPSPCKPGSDGDQRDRKTSFRFFSSDVVADPRLLERKRLLRCAVFVVFSSLWGIGLRMERGERDSNGSDVVVVVANRARRPSVNQPSSNGHEAKTKGKNLCPQKVPS